MRQATKGQRAVSTPPTRTVKISGGKAKGGLDVLVRESPRWRPGSKAGRAAVAALRVLERQHPEELRRVLAMKAGAAFPAMLEDLRELRAPAPAVPLKEKEIAALAKEAFNAPVRPEGGLVPANQLHTLGEAGQTTRLANATIRLLNRTEGIDAKLGELVARLGDLDTAFRGQNAVATPAPTPPTADAIDRLHRIADRLSTIEDTLAGVCDIARSVV